MTHSEMQHDLDVTINDLTLCQRIADDIEAFVANEPTDRQRLRIEVLRWRTYASTALRLKQTIEERMMK